MATFYLIGTSFPVQGDELANLRLWLFRRKSDGFLAKIGNPGFSFISERDMCEYRVDV